MSTTTHQGAEGAETMTAGQSLDLRDLHAANIARQAEWCPDQVPDLSFRGNELGGECGEAQNVIKKLERERQGWRGSRATKDDLADELADVVICADLCAVTADIDLGAAVRRKFNATSEKQGLSVFLPAPAPRTDGGMTAGDWLDTPLAEDVQFPGVKFGKGVTLRTVIEAARRWKADADAAVLAKLPASASDSLRPDWHRAMFPDETAPHSIRTGATETEEVIEDAASEREVLRKAVSEALHDNQFLDGWPEMVDPVVEAVLAARPAAPEAQGTWSFDMEAAPRDGTNVIVAVASIHEGHEPIVGQAFIDSDNGGHWWWAGTSYGDYYASPIHETNNPPYAWRPMLDAPAPPASSGQGGR
ncbi:MazG-like family protein [Methylorubrum rhodesianum]|uniref:MazG-like family protein n=1 Tax=Methylorubrum rhodesianum TaxID=29427 RepID=A0ABU9ZE62_9HYPH